MSNTKNKLYIYIYIILIIYYEQLQVVYDRLGMSFFSFPCGTYSSGSLSYTTETTRFSMARPRSSTVASNECIRVCRRSPFSAAQSRGGGCWDWGLAAASGSIHSLSALAESNRLLFSPFCWSIIFFSRWSCISSCSFCCSRIRERCSSRCLWSRSARASSITSPWKLKDFSFKWNGFSILEIKLDLLISYFPSKYRIPSARRNIARFENPSKSLLLPFLVIFFLNFCDSYNMKITVKKEK